MKRLVLLSLLTLFTILSCQKKKEEAAKEEPFVRDWPEIQAKGELTVATLYSSTSYFQYKMQPMGYEYELAKDFAETNGLTLRILTAHTTEQLDSLLASGAADLIAYPTFINNESKRRLLFCGHEQQTSQVIVQRANPGDTILTDVTELIGRTVHVQRGTKYDERLQHLNEELGGGIEIAYVDEDSLSNEDLIERVSAGKIRYTVSDDNIARLNRTYYWNLDTRLKISFRQRSAWAVRRTSPLLAKAIDTWASDTKRRTSFAAITKRYFELSKTSGNPTVPEVKDGHISPYDALFRKYAPLLEWDWQLLASIAYQESKFDPHVVSWAGAEGLMGIMPSTARQLGVTPHELKDPAVGIRTGVDCLRRFRQGFSEITDPDEKIKFTLAAYNAGIGHVYDAQRLATKYGKDPTVWDDNVAEYIRLKNDPEYYNDPVCKHGYLRGQETFQYVKEIIDRYHYYLKQTH